MPLKKVGDKKFKIINKAVARIDGYDKVTGRARYAADIYFPDMLYAGVLRSPYSSAKVISISADKARKIKGVKAIVTCNELKHNKSWAGYMYLTDTIRYQGDCVAMVAADTKETLEEALDAIEVKYQELPGVYTIDEALKENAHTVNPKYPDNIFTESKFKIRKGDVEKGFEKADIILEREYKTQYVEHAYIEPEACVCSINPNDGVITVNSASQNPFFTRRYVADILEVPMNRVRLFQEYIGGSFGGKEEGAGLVAARCAYLCNMTGKPVKFVFSREDSFLESPKRHPFKLRYKAGVCNGKIVAWQGEQIDNSGAYNNQTQFMNWRASVHSSGPYEIDNISTDTYGVFTNNVHSGAMRGYSSPQIIWAQEQFIDELAEKCGIDEIEFRRKNLLTDGALTATGVPLKDVVLIELMDYTVKQTEYKRKRALYKKQTSSYIRKGIGISVCYRGSGLGAESPDAAGCMIMCNEDGSVMITSGLAENGQGLKTAFAQIAAESLGVKYEDVRFFGTDTHSIPDCGMTVASRGTVMGSQAVKKTGLKLKKIMIQNAITLHMIPIKKIENYYGLKEGTINYDDITSADIDIELAEIFMKKYPEVKLSFKDLCNACLWSGSQMAAFEWNKPDDMKQDHATGQGKAFPTFAFECIVAEVSVDMKTGYVDVEKVTASHDVGTAINPGCIKGQIYGGIVMGQGFAITEKVITGKKGQKTRNFDSYIMPTAMDIPKMKINIFENDDPSGTYGAKSVGEPATEGVGAAIANAIANAIGERIYENPADLETVLLGHSLS